VSEKEPMCVNASGESLRNLIVRALAAELEKHAKKRR